MQKQGYRASTTHYCIRAIKSVAKRANLLDPESVKNRLNLKAPDAAPNAIRPLEPYLDLDFLNALAHGLFGTKGKQIVLYKNAKLEVLGILDLADFMIRSKNQNVLTQCMISVIVQKKKAGFFTPASL